MTKAKTKISKTNKTRKVKIQLKPKQKSSFGPVSTINTAPVAIGNSLSGSKPVILQSPDGARVMGRDFAFSLGSTVAAVTGWELIGGMPLTPAVLASSTLRNFNQIYNQFKINRLAFHYITSSPTSQAGDILFYHHKYRKDPMMDYTNNNFLNYVLSDTETTIGPQWTNHTIILKPQNSFKTTSYAVSADIDDDNCGELWVFSKTNSANSPGYILMDYDITFKQLSIAPRAGIFPIVRGLDNMICCSLNASTTAKVSGVASLVLTTGKVLDGSTSALPTGTRGGDVFKVVLAVTDSTATGVNAAWTNVTAANFLVAANDVDSAVTIDDGFTAYLRVSDTTAQIKVFQDLHFIVERVLSECM